MVLQRAIGSARILRVPFGSAQDGFLKVSHTSAVALQSLLSRTIANGPGSSCMGSETGEVHSGIVERTQSGGQASCSSGDSDGVWEAPYSTPVDAPLWRHLPRTTGLSSTPEALLDGNEGTQAPRVKSWDTNDCTVINAAVVSEWPSCTALRKVGVGCEPFLLVSCIVFLKHEGFSLSRSS